jgi:hypothetical protein
MITDEQYRLINVISRGIEWDLFGYVSSAYDGGRYSRYIRRNGVTYMLNQYDYHLNRLS